MAGWVALHRLVCPWRYSSLLLQWCRVGGLKLHTIKYCTKQASEAYHNSNSVFFTEPFKAPCVNIAYLHMTRRENE